MIAVDGLYNTLLLNPKGQINCYINDSNTFCICGSLNQYVGNNTGKNNIHVKEIKDLYETECCMGLHNT